MSGRGGLTWLLVAAALVWALLTTLTPAWVKAERADGGKDFASYYYAGRVALLGGDPWTRAELGALVRVDDEQTWPKTDDASGGARSTLPKGVHPFLYPPPFLLLNCWTSGFTVNSAYQIWFWMDTGLAFAVAGVLWHTHRGVSPLAGPAVAISFACLTALPNNHLMGQANLLPLLFVVSGWAAEERGYRFSAGLLVGTAAMLKMSPALFVILWLFQRNYRAFFGAIAAALALSVATLPLVDASTQLRFYTEILPTFASGGYNGLTVPIAIFGNHSLPNLVDHFFPGGPQGLSPTARAVSSTLAIGLLGSLCFRYRAAPADALGRLLMRGAVATLGLLLPVYTYEHHLVFALPAIVGLLLAIERGKVHTAVAALLGVAIAALWSDLDALRATQALWKRTVAADLLLEAKSIGLIAVCAAAAWKGRTPS